MSEPTPPVARREPKVDVIHGDTRVDDYHWLRRKNDPEVLAYLRAENAYADALVRDRVAIATLQTVTGSF